MRALGLTADNTPALRQTAFYTSHEALLLGYEEALTPARLHHQTNGTRHRATCFGSETARAARTGPTSNILRASAIPLPSNAGPTLANDDLLRLLDRLNPQDEAGRITLIGRFGADKIGEHLPRLIDTVKRAGRTMICAAAIPCMGTRSPRPMATRQGRSTGVLSEVRHFFEVHRETGTYAGGIHVEMTGDDVTECTGGFSSVTEASLSHRYHTYCDPRLNASQALELAFLVGRGSPCSTAGTSARCSRRCEGGTAPPTVLAMLILRISRAPRWTARFPFRSLTAVHARLPCSPPMITQPGSGSPAAGPWGCLSGSTGRQPRSARFAAWPTALGDAVRMMMTAGVPMVMLAGADGILIYNDAYAAFAGGRHPAIFGMPATRRLARDRRFQPAQDCARHARRIAEPG